MKRPVLLTLSGPCFGQTHFTCEYYPL